MRRRLAIIAILGILLVALILLTSTAINSGSITLKQQMAVPNFFSSAISYSNNSLLVANGRSFVVYNYLNGQAKSLGTDNIFDDSLDNIDTLSLSSNKQYIVFHSQVLPSGSALANLVQSQSSDTTTYLGYWFIYNSQDGQYQQLPSDVLRAVTYGNNVYALSIGSTGQETITAYSDSGLSQLSATSVPGISNFFPVSGGYLLEKPNNQVIFSGQSNVVENLYNSTVIYGVSSNGNTAIATMTLNGSRDLVALNYKSSAYQIVASNINSDPAWSSITNTAVYLNNQSGDNSGQLNMYNLNDNKTVSWKLGGQLNTNATPVVPLGQNGAVVSQNKNSFDLVGNGLANLKTPAKNYQLILHFSGQPVSVYYSSTTDQLTVSELDTNNLSLPGQQQGIYSQLNEDGINPYLTNIIVSVDGI